MNPSLEASLECQDVAQKLFWNIRLKDKNSEIKSLMNNIKSLLCFLDHIKIQFQL